MGKEDISLKSYLSDSRRYADLWNGGLFGGRQIIKAEDLQPVESQLSKADRGGILGRTRDMVMRQTSDGKRYVMWALENQHAVDCSMPVRIMLQEALEYDRQVQTIKRKNRNTHFSEKESNVEVSSGLTTGEYLYGVKKENRLHPIITLVVYWGEEAWEGSKCLHEIMELGEENSEMGKLLRDLIPKYPLHFLNLSEMNNYDCFQTELRILLELYARRNDKEHFLEYLESHEECKNLDDETCFMIGQLTHSKEVLTMQELKKEEKRDMCKAITDLIADGRAEGKTEGKAESVSHIRKMYSKNMSVEAIADLLDEPREYIAHVVELFAESTEADDLCIARMLVTESMR